MMNDSKTLIRAFLLAAAILALLLSTPSLHAKTIARSIASAKHKAKSKSKSKKRSHAKARAHKATVKKMKIDFSDPSQDHPADEGQLGDEVAQPRATDREVVESGEVIRTRGSSVDELWAKNQKEKRPSHRKPEVKVAARTPAPVEDDNPDLINPVSINDESIHSTPKAARAALGVRGGLEANAAAVDESSLAKFRKGVKPAAKPKVVAKAEPTPAPEKLSFDEIKNVPAKTPARPVSRAYVRHAHAVLAENHLATDVSGAGESDFKFNFALENTLTMGRAYELETKGDRNYAMKNEVFIGTNHSSGWGAKLSADYLTTSNDDSGKDVHEMGDPSIIISHPSFYKTTDLDLYGRVRYYAPVSAESRAANLQHFAYYLLTDLKLKSEMVISNAFIPHYYLQSSYADADAFSLVFDSTEFKKTFDLIRVGLGQQTQIESHQATAPGTTAELYPIVDFLGISNALIEAKMYVPVFVSGVVSGAPVAASISNLQGEFFVKLSF